MSDRRAPLVDLQMNISGANRREALPPGRPVPWCPISARFRQMWEMREAHSLWFFVVIPTGAIRRIAQRWDLLLASSILPPLQPGPLNHLGFGRCGRCAKRIRFGSLLSSRPERSEGSRSGGTCCWDLPSSQPKTVRFWQKWEARAPAFALLHPTPCISPKAVKLFTPLPKCI
jgi:hypothetical protein